MLTKLSTRKILPITYQLLICNVCLPVKFYAFTKPKKLLPNQKINLNVIKNYSFPILFLKSKNSSPKPNHSIIAAISAVSRRLVLMTSSPLLHILQQCQLAKDFSLIKAAKAGHHFFF